MDTKEQTIFRQKTLDRISSPEQLTQYLRVTSPGIWVVLIAVVLFLAGLFAWSSVGYLETREEAKVVVEGGQAKAYLTGSGTIKAGMLLRISSDETKILSVGTDEYGRVFGNARISLADGNYDGEVVINRTRAIDFLLQSD